MGQAGNPLAMRVLVTGGGPKEAKRISLALRRSGFTIVEGSAPFDLLLTLSEAPGRLRIGDLAINLTSRRVARAGRPIRLTPTEFDILALLWTEHRTIGRVELLKTVWGYSFDPGTNIVAVHVSRLRTKIGQGIVTSVAGGYRIASPGERADTETDTEDVREKLVGATGFEPATLRPPV